MTDRSALDPLVEKMIDDIARAHAHKFPKWPPLFLEPRYGAVFTSSLDKTNPAGGTWSETDDIVGYTVLRDGNTASGELDEVFVVPANMIEGISSGHAAEWLQLAAVLADNRIARGRVEGRRGVHERLRDFLSRDATSEDRLDLEEIEE